MFPFAIPIICTSCLLAFIYTVGKKFAALHGLERNIAAGYERIWDALSFAIYKKREKLSHTDQRPEDLAAFLNQLIILQLRKVDFLSNNDEAFIRHSLDKPQEPQKSLGFFAQKRAICLERLLDRLTSDGTSLVRRLRTQPQEEELYFDPRMSGEDYGRYCHQLMQSAYSGDLCASVKEEMPGNFVIAFNGKRFLFHICFKEASYVDKKDITDLTHAHEENVYSNIYLVSNALPTRAGHLQSVKDEIPIIHHTKIAKTVNQLAQEHT